MQCLKKNCHKITIKRMNRSTDRYIDNKKKNIDKVCDK